MLAAVPVYLAVQAALLCWLRTGTSVDGAEQLLYTQSFELGYGRSQPPLYTWLLIVFQHVFGVSQAAENILKFGLLGVSVFAFRALLRALGLERAATAGALALFLVPEIAWEAQRNYAHTVVLLAAAPLALLCLVRLREARTAWRYAALGGVFAALVLAKYNSLLFIASLLAADFWTARRHAAVLDRRFALTVAVALVLVAPHLWWVGSNWSAATALAGRFGVGASGDPLMDRLEGIGRYLFALLSVLGLPTLAFTLAARRLPRIPPPESALALPFAAGIILFAAGIGLILAAGVSDVSTRWVLPFVFLWLPVLSAPLEDGGGRPLRAVSALAFTAALAIMVLLAWNTARLDRRMQYDYRALVATLRAAGADTVVGTDYAVFANLRLYDPDLRVIDRVMPLPKALVGPNPVAAWVDAPNARARTARFAASLGLAVCADSPAMLPSTRGFPPLRLRIATLAPGACPAVTALSPDPGFAKAAS